MSVPKTKNLKLGMTVVQAASFTPISTTFLSD